MNYMTQKTIEYLSYATNCYRAADLSHSEACKIFARPKLSYLAERNASCPFTSEMCKQNTGNLQLDSGYLDSFDDLGMNTEPRFLFRHMIHCAPLKTDGFTEIYTDPQSPSTQYVRYNYGETNDTRAFLYETPLDSTIPENVYDRLKGDYRTL